MLYQDSLNLSWLNLHLTTFFLSLLQSLASLHYKALNHYICAGKVHIPVQIKINNNNSG